MRIFSIILLLFFCSLGFSQDSEKKDLVTNFVDSLKVDFGEELKTPNTEVEAAILELQEFNEYDRQYIRFFSSYAVPDELQEDTALILSFAVHSLIGINDDELGNAGSYYPIAMKVDGIFIPYQRSKYSDTLWWVDIRNYNWTEEVWEKMAVLDGYFTKPIITEENDGYLRLTVGNAIVRADWFIRHALDPTLQKDRQEKSRLYFDFLFANNGAPKTLDEWRLKWGIDIGKARKLGNEAGVLVTNSRIVTKQSNRFLFSYRTDLGFNYETYDVINEEGFRNYVESLFLNERIGGPPDVSDAGEMITTNQVGMQVFALRDEKGNLVEFGDPSVVRHINDVLGDVRVRTGISCMDCHSSGPIPAENTVYEFISEEGKLYLKNKADYLRIQRTLLSDKFENSVKDGQQEYARALKKVNGLSTQENGIAFLKIIRWYNQDLTIEACAFECGVNVNEFRLKMEKGKFGGNLKMMLKQNKAMPRGFWESRGKDGIPGGFQQAMILINGVTTQTIEEYQLIEVRNDCNIMSGSNVVTRVQAGKNVQYLGRQGRWIKVKYQDKEGYILDSNLRFY